MVILLKSHICPCMWPVAIKLIAQEHDNVKRREAQPGMSLSLSSDISQHQPAVAGIKGVPAINPCK